MRTHEGAEFGAMMIWCHEEIALVFVGGVAGRRLRSRCQSLEIKLISIPLAMHLRHYVLIIIISANTTTTTTIVNI